MSEWPTMWRQNTLSHAELPISRHGLMVLHLWQRSTPTEPWTLNPIGIPQSGFTENRALNTPYAAFPTWKAFYEAFTKALTLNTGKALGMALSGSESLPEAWRAINAMEWPGSKTETDYPSALLDSLESDFRESLSKANGQRRKTTGRTLAQPDAGSRVSQAARSAMRNMSAQNASVLAVNAYLRRMNGNG